ncbi:MAG: aspartate/glutamate racemase family protein, partial [Candidatus Thorarchaeota archaeon]
LVVLLRRIALIGATGLDWLKDPRKREFVDRTTPPGYEIVSYMPRYGTHSVESLVDEAYNAPYILEQVVRASRDGVDAVLIDCACDPALDAAREVTEIPVVGMLRSALHIALTLGRTFGVITLQGESLVRCFEHRVRAEGLAQFCRAIEFLKIPVLDIAKYPERAQSELLEACKSMVEKHRADVVVLGCTGLSHYMDLNELMRHTGVPVIDPYLAGLWTAVAYVEMGMAHSRVAYPAPPKKEITEPDVLAGSFDDILKSD